MSSSDRERDDPTLKWAIPLVGLLLAIGIAWGIGFLQSREAEHRYHTPREYHESAKSAASRACAGREPVSQFECVAEHVESSKQQANSDQDLSAQQRAASSSLLAAIIAFLTMIVTIIGVYFVKRTLEATLKAVEDTAEATEAMKAANRLTEEHNRPWLSFRINEHFKTTVTDGGVTFWFKTTIENFGSFPAEGVRLIAYAYPVCKNPIIPRFEEPLEKNEARMAALANHPRQGFVISPSEICETHIQVTIHLPDLISARREIGDLVDARWWVFGEARLFYFWGHNLGFIDKAFSIDAIGDAVEGFSFDLREAGSQKVVMSGNISGRVGKQPNHRRDN